MPTLRFRVLKEDTSDVPVEHRERRAEIGPPRLLVTAGIDRPEGLLTERSALICFPSEKGAKYWVRKHDGELETGKKGISSVASPWVKRSLSTRGRAESPRFFIPNTEGLRKVKGHPGGATNRLGRSASREWASLRSGRRVERHRPPFAGKRNCCCEVKPTRRKWIKLVRYGGN